MIRNERRKINKRKRNILKSISSISIHRQPLIKKLKKQNTRITSTTTTAVANNSYYRQPKYLKWSTFMLFRLLKQMFNYLFKKKIP